MNTTQNAPGGHTPTDSVSEHHKPTNWGNIALLIFFILLTVGGGIYLSQPLFVKEKPPLRIAINPWPGYEFASLARELGYFKEEGVSVQLVELSSLGDSRRAYERGQVDGFFGTAVEVLLSKDQSNRNPQITLATNYSNGADLILARPPITSVSELRGKRVAFEPGSLNSVVLSRALTSAGLKWKDVIPVPMAAIDMPIAFKDGTVDAVVTYPPMSIEIINQSPYNQIYSTKEIPGVIVDFLAIDSETIASHRDEISAFHRAFFKAQDFARKNPDIAIPIMARRERITPQEFKSALDSGIILLYREDQANYFKPNGKIQSILQVTASDLSEMGLIDDPQSAAASFATLPQD